MRIGRMAGALGAILSISLPAFAGGDEEERDAEPYEVVKDADVGPRIVKQTQPRYPTHAFQVGAYGTVLIEFVIDAKGRVRDPKVIPPKGPPRADLARAVEELNAAALETVRKWRFKPAQKDGQPVATVARAPVSFKIGDRPPRAK
jgi:TonB family protein